MRALVDLLRGAQGRAPIVLTLHRAEAAPTAEPCGRRRQGETASQIAAEYWAARIMWLLVAVTSCWDIAVTFGRHFASAMRYF
jgi:hypothetical protein